LVPSTSQRKSVRQDHVVREGTRANPDSRASLAYADHLVNLDPREPLGHQASPAPRDNRDPRVTLARMVHQDNVVAPVTRDHQESQVCPECQVQKGTGDSEVSPALQGNREVLEKRVRRVPRARQVDQVYRVPVASWERGVRTAHPGHQDFAASTVFPGSPGAPGV